MSKDFTADTTALREGVFRYLNTWEDKPCEIGFEDMGDEETSMMFQQLSRSWKIKEYVTGAYSGAYAFAVLARVDGTDTNSRLSGAEYLDNLFGWMIQRDDHNKLIHLPVISDSITVNRIDMPSTPSISNRGDDGSTVFQAIFTLYFKKEE